MTATVPAITEFRNDYYFLSNFSDAEIIWYGVWPTSEHLFQARKTYDDEWTVKVRQAPTAHAAKRLGRQLPCRADWDQVKKQVMLETVLEKFSQNRHLRDRLVQTAPAILIEGNAWNDDFWGAVAGPGTINPAMTIWTGADGTQYQGHNWLGRILMMTRDILS